jgi:single-stranded DNA-binding protein
MLNQIVLVGRLTNNPEIVNERHIQKYVLQLKELIKI